MLDVGAGMTFHPGNYIMSETGVRKELDIHYIDPLAPYYNEISKKHNRNVPQVEFGMAEYLSAFHKEGSVSLVIIQNALDHSAIPMKGIREVLTVLEVGGKLYLNHHPKEAEKENYKGFHKWNFTTEDSHLVLYNREERIVVDEELSSVASIVTKVADDGHIVSVLTKTHDYVQNTTPANEDRSALASALIEETMRSMSLLRGMKYSMQYQWFNAIQFFVQALPYDIKMAIKNSLKL